jgi:antitoxin MazE
MKTPQKRIRMKGRIVRIGNSRGVRLPKTLIEHAGVPEEVELLAEPGRIVVKAIRRPRAGWAEAAQRMRQREEDYLIDPPTATKFAEEEWVWR